MAEETRTGIPGWCSTEAPAAQAPTPDPQRFEPGPLLGRGGMGEVWRLWDRQLQRAVALKVLRAGMPDPQRWILHFQSELRITARLDHPGVMAIHDAGRLPDGRPWYLMREVPDRRTLSRALLSAQLDQDQLIRLGLRIAEVLAYAHSQGVLHRDLKPDNVLLGAFGEVLLADWGIASGPGEPPPAAAGSPGWSAPEQLSGAAPSTEQDVYAFGRLMQSGLRRLPPSSGRERSELESWLQDCSSPQPIDRPRDGRELVDFLSAWSRGEQRRKRALELVRLAQSGAADLGEMRGRAEELAREARRAGASCRPFDPVDRKQGWWALEERALRAREAVEEAEAELEGGLQAALEQHPELPEALAAMAHLQRDRLLRAEAMGDRSAARRAERRLAAVDRGAHAAFLRGQSRLELDVEVEGATLELCRCVERERRLVLEPIHTQPSPLRLDLPHGSYVVEARAPGHLPLRYPLLLGRGEHYLHQAPNRSAPQPLRLARLGELSPDEVLVPAGWAWLGGDPLAADPAPRRRLWVGAFALRRRPLSMAEYALFLQRLWEQEGADGLDELNPRLDLSQEAPSGERLFQLVDETVVISPGLPSWAPHLPRHPIAHLERRMARRCLAWLAREQGLPWRLPWSWEREKAARGADGRSLPWGEHFEPTWAAVAESTAGPPFIRTIDHPTEDRSLYGAEELCGNVRDPCLDAWRRDGPELHDGQPVEEEALPDQLCVVAGGAWRAQSYLCRPAGRLAAPDHAAIGVLSLRPCRSWPA